jgi:uncharacterized protein (DUF1810 family)
MDYNALDRFESAQDRGDIYATAVSELRSGRKIGHWMWFIFPQITGLGLSTTSQRYAIASLHEAQAYLGHPILGPRLLTCSRIVAALDKRTATEIFGNLDAMKLRSSMTLFARAAPNEPVFQQVLDKYFDGRPDLETIRRLDRMACHGRAE